MKTTSPQRTHYAPGFPELLDSLRDLPDRCVPGLSLGLYGLLRAAGMKIGYAECDVISGQAGKFVYSREDPDCVELSFVPPVDTLFRSLGVTWKEVTPSDAGTAFGLVKEWVDHGGIALARFSEPLLIYGYVEMPFEISLIAARISTGLKEEIVSIAECEKLYWRYPLDEANMLIRVEKIPDKDADLTLLTKAAARRTVAQWKHEPLSGCEVGLAAYKSFARDLADVSVDFTIGQRQEWTGRNLWMQWTARRSLQLYFERMAPRFGGKERHALTKAGFYFGECTNAWEKFARLLGPTWNFSRSGFNLEIPASFWDRWRSAELRIRAAQWVEEAGGWEAKAVEELVLLFGLTSK